MTVKELIEELKAFPEDVDIMITGSYGASAPVYGKPYLLKESSKFYVVIPTDIMTG